MEITYQEVREEVKDLVKMVIEEAMKDAGDEDELREKVQDTLHEVIDGHAWGIYYAKAYDLCDVIRRCDRQWYDTAYSELQDIGGDVLGKDEDLDNLYTRLAYCVLDVGAWNAYEDVVEEIFESAKENAKERGKAWAQGFKDNSSTREEAYAAEENGRQYTPFEFTAKEFNDSPWSDELWEAFQEGIDEVFAPMLSEDDVEYWLCPDCLQAAVNDDYTGLDYYHEEREANKRKTAIEKGLNELGSIANTGHVLTFSRCGCGCCGSELAGERHGFVMIKTGGAEE